MSSEKRYYVSAHYGTSTYFRTYKSAAWCRRWLNQIKQWKGTPDMAMIVDCQKEADPGGRFRDRSAYLHWEGRAA